MNKMNEYISKDKIIQDIEEEIGISNMALDEDVWFNRGLKTALSYIKKIPTANVQPVMFARWIDLDNRILCSGCGAGYDDANEVKCRTYIFCPNCGAKMTE